MAILITKNVLVNIDKDYLFIASIALIVGLHFIPLAKVFERKFDYYIGIWTITIAIIGLILIINKNYDYRIVNAFVCVACAVSTSLCGLKMINNGKIILKENLEKKNATNMGFGNIGAGRCNLHHSLLASVPGG